MDWIEEKYINYVSGKLRNFKRKGPHLFNFSCPICGDSLQKKNKARAYIYEKEGKMLFHCHNCSKTMSAMNLIKTIDNQLHNEYLMEQIENRKSPQQKEFESFTNKMKMPIFMKEGPLKGLKKVSQLSPSHPVKIFIDSRKIPSPYHSKLFSCPNFMTWANNIIPNKFSEKSLKYDETRLIIPYFDFSKNIHAINARSINKSEVKYIKLILNENVPTIFGLDNINLNKTSYIFEGEFDSMFIPNSLATGGGDLISAIKTLPKENMIIVYDNEPRSKETYKKLDKAIMNGYSVCIWPNNILEKDINEMILSGMKPEYIEHIIKKHSCQGLEAKLSLSSWSK